VLLHSGIPNDFFVWNCPTEREQLFPHRKITSEIKRRKEEK